YDAVGNLLSISRQPSSQLSIISVVPNRGSVGQMVTIYGTGFSAVPSQNTVEFGGTAATIISATATRIVTTVPSLGITGQVQVSVTTSQGTVSAPFMVLPGSNAPSIQVSPQYVSILPGDTLQFFATVTGLSGNQSLSWSVNGVNSGNSDLGTISAAGFYSSPNRPNSIFTIRATSVADPAVFGQAQVGVLNPSQSEAVIPPSTSVFRRPPIDSAPHTALSVRRRSSDSVASITPGVSVRRLLPTETGTPIATAISVRRWPPVESGSPQSPNLSITTGPIIQSVAPASAGKGTVVTLTITGANLGGATALSFLTTAGAIDSTITASSIAVNANGTELTATVTISTGTAVGQRVVVVVTPTSHSLAVTAGANVLEIVQ
ncbi:MAG: IPT/TIG domain-containing protein, partial [Acidobacteria bacterium]|nr:IPT/TIG domain-containing protein [Acidobacteriota bacterium]